MHFNETVWAVHLFVITDSELQNSEFKMLRSKDHVFLPTEIQAEFFSLATPHGYKKYLERSTFIQTVLANDLGHWELAHVTVNFQVTEKCYVFKRLKCLLAQSLTI